MQATSCDVSPAVGPRRSASVSVPTAVTVFNSGGNVDVIVDVVGWYW
jgi:hypothetical protein